MYKKNLKGGSKFIFRLGDWYLGSEYYEWDAWVNIVQGLDIDPASASRDEKQ